jgi:hypothetical protein
MAHSRRSPQHRIPSPPARKYPLRRSPPSRRRQELDEFGQPSDIRPVLVPLHQNLRRLPSRLYLGQIDQSDKDNFMAPHVARVGTKRKRVANRSARNENTAHYTRASTRSKRRRSDNLPTPRKTNYVTTTDEDEDEEVGEREDYAVDDDGLSGMDVDTTTNGQASSPEGSDVASDQEQNNGDDDDHDSELTPNSDDDSSEFPHPKLLI